MKNKLLFIAVLICFELCNLKAQYNLVPNPSFEQFDTCPNAAGQIRYAIPWTNPLYFSSPDYLNSCNTGINFSVPTNHGGYEPARTGNAYSLIVTYTHHPPSLLLNNYREYLQSILTDTLISGVNYCIQFYVSACDSSPFVSNNIGMYFSSTEVYDTCIGHPCNLLYGPQFENPSTNNLNNRNGWSLVSGSYTAQGGEKYIIIGNFRDSVTTTATYSGWVSQTNAFGIYYVDDVLVTPCDSLTGTGNFQIYMSPKIFPNPVSDFFEISSTDKLIKKIEIYDMTGRLIYKKFNINKIPFKINFSNKPKGIYLLTIITNRNQYKMKLFKN